MSRIDHHRPRYPELYGQFRKSYHLEMVSDWTRTHSIFHALCRALAPGMVFCDLGCGAGIFSTYAAERTQRVYAVEIDPVIAETAKENFASSPFADRIEFIEGNACELDLPERADVIFCEMMSIWCVEEAQVPVFNDAFERHLKPGGVFLPQRIVNLVDLGHYDFQVTGIEMKAVIPLFTGIAGPAVLTETRVAKTLNFSAPVNRDLSCTLELDAVATGTVNCARLTSIVQMGPEVVFSGTDSLMPSTVVPLSEEVSVRAGDRLRLQASVRARSDLGESIFRVERI